MKRQRGFSIIAVVFILVVLAGLAGVIAQLGATQHLGTLMAQEGRQAWYAARAGLEAGRSRAQTGDCGNTALEFQGFTVAVTCERLPEDPPPYREGDTTLVVYTLLSTASRNSGPLGEISRSARMTLWSPQ